MNKVFNPLPLFFIFIISVNIIVAIKIGNIFSVIKNIIGLLFFISLALEHTKFNEDKKISKYGFICSITFIFLYIIEMTYLK
ncbi:MAG: hypothetical protein IJH34_07125 [Romboutsia sp.]|nr:hypothetical protein [Romboutsia sp.]